MTLVDAAERSTLGALLHTPSSVPEVGCWLEPTDFLHPRNAIAYELICDHAVGSGLGPLELLTAARDRDDARRNHLDGPYVHDLVRSPGSPDRPAVYGRMVLEAAIRRRVTREGVRLHRAARSTHVEGLAWPMEQVDRATESLVVLSNRLTRAGVPAAEPGSAPARHGRTPGRDRLHSQERAALAALLTRPSALEDVAGWLRPEDFGFPEHAATYAAIQALRGAAEPIEPLTVAWLAGHRPAVLPLRDLASLASFPVVRPAQAVCRELLELRLKEAMAAASAAVVLTSLRRDLSGPALLAASLRHLAGLDETRSRLSGVGRPATGPRGSATRAAHTLGSHPAGRSR